MGVAQIFSVIAVPVVAGILLVFVVSVLFANYYFLGRARTVAMRVVLITWGCAFFAVVIYPDYKREWRLSAWNRCEKELTALPRQIQTKSVLASYPLLFDINIADLLIKRRLDFVEIRLGKIDSTGSITLARQNFYKSPEPWIVKADVGREFAKVAIANAKDKTCSTLSYSLSEVVERPPSLPGTCLQVTYADIATSQHELQLTPALVKLPFVYGSARLVERTQQQIVAELTFASEIGDASSAHRLSESGATQNADCRTPVHVLLDRLENRRVEAGQ